MAYVDGYVIVVPKKNVPAYRRLARKAGKIWREHGALDFCECVGDDLRPKDPMAFPKIVKAKPSETVMFSWVVYRSKADRNRVIKMVMTDPRLAHLDPKTMPFDMNRMAWGGFKILVHM
jgi:uncharacterized protein YbaA (DUF1428 family)